MLDNTIGQSLTLTKLRRPRVSRELVPRPHLLQRLNKQRGLTLVLAPAGYGKTTLISTWLDACGLPSAWLSLDEHDSDLGLFATYFVAAVQTLFPDAGVETLALLNGVTVPPLPVVAHSLLNELNAIPQEFILVLDDYHTIQERAVHDLLTELLRHPLPTLHLVLCARNDPPLPIANLRARGQVVELRAADLRFTLEEAAILVRDVMEVAVDERTISVLEVKTEGWPVGLCLAALSLRHQYVPGMIAADASGYNRYVIDYLAAEVISRLTPAIQDFLVKISILDHFCGPLCEAVVGVDDPACDGQAYLEWLERADLFLMPVDDERRWYRCHPLFQQLLMHRLEQQHSPAEISALHLRASAWFAQNRYLEEALHHALAAGDRPAAVQIVARHRHELMNQDQWQRLERWVHLFPRQLIDEQPELLLTEVWIKFLRQQLADVPGLLDRVENLIPQMSLEPAAADRLQGEVEARRSAQYYWAGDAARSQSAARQALEKIPTEWWYLRASTRLFLSGGYQMSGDLAQAYAVLYDSGEPDQGRLFQMRLLGSACLIHWVAADLSGMARAARQVLDWNDNHDRPEAVTWSHYYLGLFHYQHNDLVAAEKYLIPIVLRPYLSHAMCFLNSAALLALIYQAQGQPDKAREIVEVMLSVALETHGANTLFAARAFQAELALRQGRLAEASQWATQYEVPLSSPLPYFYTPPVTLARILLAQDTPASRQQAGQVLSELVNHVTTIHYTHIQIPALALQAMLHCAEGDEERALAALEQAIVLAEPGGFIRLFVDLGPRLDPLLARLAQRGVASAYIAEIRAAFDGPEVQPANAAKLEKVVAAAVQTRSPILAEILTNREMDVLLLLEQRLTNKEIAQTLGISTNTVRGHAVTLFQKLHVDNRRQAVVWARQNGLLPLARPSSPP